MSKTYIATHTINYRGKIYRKGDKIPLRDELAKKILKPKKRKEHKEEKGE